MAIVTNAGGPGILCADACQAGGLEVPRLPAAARRRLAGLLAPEASLGNPIDMIATASAEDYRRTIETAGRGGGMRRDRRDLRAAAVTAAGRRARAAGGGAARARGVLDARCS